MPTNQSKSLGNDDQAFWYARNEEKKNERKEKEKKRERRNSELTMHAYSIFFDLGESPP